MLSHSVVAPSSAAQWVHCAASVKAQEGIEDTDHAHRGEGHALHEVAHRALEGVQIPHVPGETVEGVILTEEMLDRVNQYITYINSIRGDNPHFEERIPCTRIHPECFGTADYWEYDSVMNELTIADYKDGYLIVSPVENWQLITYFSGILDQLPQGIENTLKVRFVIVQPRSYGDTLKIWNCKATDLRGHINRLHYGAYKALGVNPECKAGEHCRYCKAMFSCPSSTVTVNSLAHVGIYTPEATTNDVGTELSFLKYAAKMIQHRISAVESRVFQTIKKGGTVPGFTTGTGRGKLNWKDDTTGVADIASLMGVDIHKKTMVTPTQAKDAGIPAEMLKPFTVYKSGKAILKPVNLNKLKLVFGNQ